MSVRKDESSFKIKSSTHNHQEYVPEQPAKEPLIAHRSQLLGINGSTAVLNVLNDK